MNTLDLDTLLDPASLVLVGASDRADSPGRSLAENLITSDYSGELHLVNPRYRTVLGAPCFPSLKHIDGVVDLALILVPSALLKRSLEQCASKGIRVAVIYSNPPADLDLRALAKALGMRLVGPWSAGLIRPHSSLNATFANNRLQAGELAIISQSGTLAAALLDWAESHQVGFSTLITPGSESDVDVSDLLDLMAADTRTRAIIVYLKHIRDSRSFVSAISAAARLKPVVLMKSSQHDARYCNRLAHSGHELSTDDVFQAALSRAGAVRIRTYSNLFSAATILSSGSRLRGKRIAIVSNGAATAMLATERLCEKRFALPSLDPQVDAALLDALTAVATEATGEKSPETGSWIGSNPIELRDAEHLDRQLQATLKVIDTATNIDAVLVIFVPDTRHDTEVIANALINAKPLNKPVIACWMGDAHVFSDRAMLSEAGIPNFTTPEDATDAIDFLYRYHRSQQQLIQLPAPTATNTRIDPDSARPILRAALDNGERVLGHQRTQSLLQLFDVELLPSAGATTPDSAVAAAQVIGYPVVVKLVSPNIAWKAPIVPTALNIEDDDAVRAAFETARTAVQRDRPDAEFHGVLIESQYSDDNTREIAISLYRDATFGAVISISIGGDLAALMHTRVVQLPPLNTYLIDEMLNEPPLSDYLGAFRHKKAIDTKPLAALLRRVSEIACELPDVYSLDINPVIVSSEKAVVVDVSIVVERYRRPAGSPARYGHLTIHPWPRQWSRIINVKNGQELTLRAIRPEDGDALQSMVMAMSAKSRYFRFMHTIKGLSPAMLAQFTKLDYDRQIAFVADPGDNTVAGVSRYAIDRDARSAEFAISVADDWQGNGLATQLMELLIEHARVREIDELHGDVLRENTAMLSLMKKLGFTSTTSPDDADVLIHTLSLNPPTVS